jgi:HlyD family secretion protein
MKKLILFVLVLAAAGGGYYYYKILNATPEPTVMTQPVSRGDIVDSVGATGTLEAVETVDVGTQVSGVVQELHADFNDIVKKGQIIAKLDPQLIQTQIENQTANVIRAEADLSRLKVSLDDAKQKLDRAEQMSAKQLIPKTELETADVNVRSAEAQIRSSEAALTQARAQLNNQKVNLGYTTITAPIDGIIISRNVDQGQTVASSMNAPVLYVIAADLTKMQVLANIDEADVGRMRPNQHVTFRVDAFPTDTFTGTVSQVRLQPAVVQNVVTYSTVISVPNPDLKLKPGMTAQVNIEINRRTNVLRVPNAATRFRPTPEMFAVLKQPVPPELERGRGGFAGRGMRGEGQRGGNQPAAGAPAGQPPAAPAATPPSGAKPTDQQAPPPVAQSQGTAAREPRGDATANRAPGAGEQARNQQPGIDGGGRGAGSGRGGFDPNMTPEERRKRMEERLKNMTPEERERFEARMREGGRGGFGGGRGTDRGTDGNGPQGGNRQGGNQNAGRNQTSGENQSRTMASGATTIDSLFGPLPVVESRGSIWQYENRQLKMIRLRLGVTDQTFTEVLNESDVPANAEVVINMTTGLEPRTQPGQNQQNNPLMGPQRGGPGGRGGGPGGGGGGGGRGRG